MRAQPSNALAIAHPSELDACRRLAQETSFSVTLVVQVEFQARASALNGIPSRGVGRFCDLPIQRYSKHVPSV